MLAIPMETMAQQFPTPLQPVKTSTRSWSCFWTDSLNIRRSHSISLQRVMAGYMLLISPAWFTRQIKIWLLPLTLESNISTLLLLCWEMVLQILMNRWGLCRIMCVVDRIPYTMIPKALNAWLWEPRSLPARDWSRPATSSTQGLRAFPPMFIAIRKSLLQWYVRLSLFVFIKSILNTSRYRKYQH